MFTVKSNKQVKFIKPSKPIRPSPHAKADSEAQA